MFYASSIQNTVPRWLLICTSGLMLFPVSPSSSVNFPYLFLSWSCPTFVFPQDYISQGRLAHVDSSPVTSQLNVKPRRQQVNPCGYLLLCFGYYPPGSNSRGGRFAAQPCWAGPVGLCVSDRVNQTNESAVSQPHPCSHVQDLHFRQTLQSPDSDFQGKSLHVSSTRGTDAVVW